MKQPKRSEHDIQSECVRLFRYMYAPLQWRFFAIGNGGKRNIIVAAKMKKEGVLAGVWDCFLSVPRNGKSGLFIETKVKGNKLTDNQIKFRQENEADYAFEVVYSTEEFITAVNNYLTIKEV